MKRRATRLLAPSFLVVASVVVACDDSDGAEIPCCNPPAPMQMCPDELPEAGEACTASPWRCDTGNGYCVWQSNCFITEPECGVVNCRGVWEVKPCSGSPPVGGAGGEVTGGVGGEASAGGPDAGGAGGLAAGGLSGEE